MERIDWSRERADGRRSALSRPPGREDKAMIEAVRAMFEDVRLRGWDALSELSRRIDGAEPELIEVGPFAETARRTLPTAAQEGLELAANNIRAFHEATRPRDVILEVMPGLTASKSWRAIDKAGLYIPGGKAPLFSTLLMLAIPARIAGVRELIVVTPPRSEGGLALPLALAAETCGIAGIWTVGGAQAIAALTFGAGPIPGVDLICGPGNAWVATAKTLAAAIAGGPGIDLPAGPSELMVIADDSADPSIVAADLLSQAEHDLDAQVILVSTSAELIDSVDREFQRQAAVAGGKYAKARAIRCADLTEAVAIANTYAPEHLSLSVEGANSLVGDIRSAGAIFVGGPAAETFGDYLVGSSHVLPTDGAARFTGGVSTLSFMKAISVQSISSEAARKLAAPAAALARLEGLEAHARAAEARA